MSWGPVSWVVPNEVVPTRIRAKVLALGVTLNWFADYLVVSTFLSARRAVGAAAVFAFYALVCAAAWLFTWVFVDESKGRSLDEPVAHAGASSAPALLSGSDQQQGGGNGDRREHGAGAIVVHGHGTSRHGTSRTPAGHSASQQDNEALPLIAQRAWMSDQQEHEGHGEGAARGGRGGVADASIQ